MKNQHVIQNQVQSSLRSLSLHGNIAVYSGILGSIWLLHLTNMWLLATAGNWYLPIGWLLGGVILWGAWTVGHDQVHLCVRKHRQLSRFIGRLAFLPTLYPFETTTKIHLEHHRHLNNAERDTAWNPWPVEKFQKSSPLVKILYRLMRTFTWFFGTVFFLISHHQLKNIPPGRKGSFIACLSLKTLYIAGTAWFMFVTDGSWIVSVLFPFLFFAFIFSTITLMHHSRGETEEAQRVRWHDDDKALNSVSMHTVDHKLPVWLGWALFNGHLHTIHHLSPTIPFYHLPKANAVIDKRFPGFIQYRRAELKPFVWVLRNQHLFDRRTKEVTRFE